MLAARAQETIRPVTVTVEIDGETEVLTQDSFSYLFNTDEVLANPTQNATLTAKATEVSVAQAANAIAGKYSTEPQNASVAAFHPFAEERFEFNDSCDGRSVNADDLTEKILQALENGGESCTVSAAAQRIPAAVTTEELRNNMVLLGSAQTFTTTDSQERINATHNMEVALAACNQYNEILPGEIWSFNTCTGDSNLESNGYVAATVIADGQYAQGVGGGICQASGFLPCCSHPRGFCRVPDGCDACAACPACRA